MSANESKNNLTIQEVIDEVKGLWFGIEGKPAEGYVGLCLSGEAGELTELILDAFINKHVGKLNNYIKKELRDEKFREELRDEIESEIPDIVFYVAKLIAIRGINFDEIWHRKMNHNEKKYGRPIKDRPFTCKCTKCRDHDIFKEVEKESARIYGNGAKV